ncbi:MAG: peptidylprolyl isomerase [bacterium]|nr:peptidylprolyl isomerase [bacterium]
MPFAFSKQKAMLSLHKSKSTALRVLSVFALALVVFAVLISGCGKKGDYVAKVGGKYVSTDAFKNAMLMRYRTPDVAAQRNLEERKQVLKNLIDGSMKLQEAYRLNLQNDSTVKASALDAQKQAAIQELYKVEIMDKVIPPSEVKAVYDKMGEEIHARHILFSTPVDLVPLELDSVRARAVRARDQLRAGANFDSLAKIVSNDVTTAQAGGDLGYFTWGRMVDEFQDAAFALKVDQISDTIKSSYGYHIIKVEDRRPSKERGTYEIEQPNILMQLRSKYQEKLGKEAEAYLNKLKEEHKLKYDYANIQKVLDKVSDPSVPRNNDYFSNFKEDEKDWAVATYDDKKITVKDLAKDIEKTGRAPRWRDQQAIISTVERMLIPEFLAERAKDRGLYKSADVQKTYNDMIETNMSQRVDKVQVEDKLKVSEPAQLAYYENNMKDFQTDSMVTVQEIYVNVDEKTGRDEAFAQKIAVRAKKGEDFTKLVHKYSDRKSSLSMDGVIGPLTSRQYGAMGREAFNLKVSEISDPIAMGRRGFSIIKVIEKTPSRVKVFEEAKAEVDRQMRMAQTDSLKKAWTDDMDKRYKITIFDDKLMAVFPYNPAASDSSKLAVPPEPMQPSKVIPIKPGDPKK